MKSMVRKFKLACVAVALTLIPSVVLAQDVAEPAAPDAAAENSSSPEAGEDVPDAAEGTDAASEAPATEEEVAGDEEAEAPASDAEAPEPLDGATYRVRLRDLEQRVDELKEQIRRSHTRLSLLSDTILSGASGGARAEIEFVNDLSGAWHVIEAIFVLDGAVQYKKTDDSGVLAKQRTIPIFSGSVPTGDHTLQVMLKLRGHGFGVFSYLRGMEASLKADHSFTLTDGKVLELRATAWEQGGPTTPVEQQPDIRFNQSIRSASDTPKASPVEAKSGGKVETKSSRDGASLGGDATLGGGVSTEGK